MRKQIFRSCYFLDRQVSIVPEKRFATSDHDIDVPLPFEVDEVTDNIHDFKRVIARASTTAPDTE